MKYILEVHGDGEHGNQVQLAIWTADTPFGAISVGDTLDPSKWKNPLHNCIFRVASVEHLISQFGSGTETETVHNIWLSCDKETQS